MSARRSQLALFLIFGALLYLPVACSAQNTQSQPDSLPGDFPSLRLEQIPLGPAVISYQDGQLTIRTQNATLSEVLRAVGRRTGAVIDLSPGDDERMVGTLGPGPPRDVIASLLDGSNFNYVLLGSADDPNGLARVILSPKPPDAAAQRITVRQEVQPGLSPAHSGLTEQQKNMQPLAQPLGPDAKAGGESPLRSSPPGTTGAETAGTRLDGGRQVFPARRRRRR